MFHIVDDADFVRRWVASAVHEHGYASQSFDSPDSYLEFVSSDTYEKPIAVFVDVNLPVMSGYDMIHAVSEQRPGLKFVIMTGEPGVRSLYNDMACMYLAKPFESADIAKILDSIMRCHAFAPADDHRCTNVDDRSLFPVDNWSCPHQCKSSQSDGISAPIHFWSAKPST
jgi:FixJ family two-component response regulator